MWSSKPPAQPAVAVSEGLDVRDNFVPFTTNPSRRARPRAVEPDRRPDSKSWRGRAPGRLRLPPDRLAARAAPRPGPAGAAGRGGFGIRPDRRPSARRLAAAGGPLLGSAPRPGVATPPA